MVPAGGVEGGGGVAAPAQRRGGAGGGQVAAAVGGGASATRESNSQLRVDPGRRCVCVCGGGGQEEVDVRKPKGHFGNRKSLRDPLLFPGSKSPRAKLPREESPQRLEARVTGFLDPIPIVFHGKEINESSGRAALPLVVRDASSAPPPPARAAASHPHPRIAMPARRLGVCHPRP